MEPERCAEVAPRVVMGLIVFTLGVLFLLDELDYLSMGELWDYWPLVFVGVGLNKLMQPAGAAGRATGAVFIAVGVWWLLANLDVLEHDPVDLWPVLLMLIGGSILWRAVEASRHPQPEMLPVPPPFPGETGASSAAPAGTGAPVASVPPATAGYDVDTRINAVGVLGGVGRKCASRDFRGGSMTAIMGGCEVDLRQASIASGSATIDAFALWGGIEIRVPRDWTVVSKGIGLLGGFGDSTAPPPAPTGKVLVVRGMAIMAGVEIKN